MNEAFLCTGFRTPIGRYAGALAGIRPDDLLAHAIRCLVSQVPSYSARRGRRRRRRRAGQSGGRRQSQRGAHGGLLAGLPQEVPGSTINQLCGSGLDAVGIAARAIRAGEADIIIAGGVESISRSPFVQAKADAGFFAQDEMFDTTLGWRFVNPRLKSRYGVDSMAETAENLAEERRISRPIGPLRAQEPGEGGAAQANGRLAREIAPVEVTKGKTVARVERDEHPRATTLEKLAALPTPFRKGGTVTAGNSSGINDGAAALLIASRAGIERYGLTPLARIAGLATAGVAPRIMGIGPVPATKKLLDRLGLAIGDFDVRTQRSFRRAVARLPARLRPARRCRARQSERRGDRARPSARHVGGAARPHRGDRARRPQSPPGACHDVHRRRPGHRARWSGSARDPCGSSNSTRPRRRPCGSARWECHDIVHSRGRRRRSAGGVSPDE